MSDATGSPLTTVYLGAFFFIRKSDHRPDLFASVSLNLCYVSRPPVEASTHNKRNSRLFHKHLSRLCQVSSPIYELDHSVTASKRRFRTRLDWPVASLDNPLAHPSPKLQPASAS